MTVTTKTFPSHDWSKLKQNTMLDYRQMSMKPIAVLGAVSREKGIEHVMTFPKSVNITKFKTFLEELRIKNPFDDVILMMDNLSIHRSQQIRDRMDELGFRWAYTPRYSPWYNGIEEVWSMSKRYIRKKRLSAIMNDREVEIKELIMKSFERMQP